MGIGTDMIKDGQTDDLDMAAKDLGVTTDQLKTDMATNIRGGAAVLRDYALQLSANHTLPARLPIGTVQLLHIAIQPRKVQRTCMLMPFTS